MRTIITDHFFLLILTGDGMNAQEPFNGLGMNLGNLSRLSRAKTRSISAENFNGEKGKGGMATDGTGAGAARDLGRTWKISPCVRIKAKGHVHRGRHPRRGRHSADLDDPDRELALRDPPYLLGRREDPIGRSTGRRLSSRADGASMRKSHRSRSA